MWKFQLSELKLSTWVSRYLCLFSARFLKIGMCQSEGYSDVNQALVYFLHFATNLFSSKLSKRVWFISRVQNCFEFMLLYWLVFQSWQETMAVSGWLHKTLWLSAFFSIWVQNKLKDSCFLFSLFQAWTFSQWTHWIFLSVRIFELLQIRKYLVMLILLNSLLYCLHCVVCAFECNLSFSFKFIV